MIKWIVIYSDSHWVSSEQWKPEDIRRDGVQVVIYNNDDMFRLHMGDQFYCWQDDTWIPHSFSGMLQYLKLPGKEKIVLEGFQISDVAFQSILAFANALMEKLNKYKQ